MEQKELKQKISRAQAILEQTGELTLTHGEQSIQILQVEFEGATGWKVGSQILSHPADAVAAARREIGDTLGSHLNDLAGLGTQLGTAVLSMGLSKLAIVCVTSAERLNKIR